MRGILSISVLASLALAACAPAAPPSPTAAPPKPAATTAPAPTTAPAKPAATTAPAKPAATTAPAAKPTEKPAAKPEFDEKAVTDFFKGKTIRIVVGFAPGGATDTNARTLQVALGKYIPGNPTIVIENKPGGGGMLAANTVYASEPKDGTVWAGLDSQLVLQQATGAPGVQFDAGKFSWLGSSYKATSMCAVRTELGINSVQEVMGPSGKEMTVSSFGKGGISYNPPAVFNAALGTRFNIITGYDGGAAQRLAVKNKEVQGFCTTVETVTSVGRDLMEGSNPVAKIILVGGAEPYDHPFTKGVPAAEALAKTDEAKAMLRVVEAPGLLNQPIAAPPDVPRDRVQALRRAFDQAYKDPQYLEAAAKAQLTVTPKTGEQVTQIVQQVLSTAPATLAKLKQVLE